jgi:hypothetical protein
VAHSQQLALSERTHGTGSLAGGREINPQASATVTSESPAALVIPGGVAPSGLPAVLAPLTLALAVAALACQRDDRDGPPAARPGPGRALSGIGVQ